MQNMLLNTANVIHMNTTLYNQKIFRHKSDDIYVIQRVKLYANGSEMMHSILQNVQIRCIFDLKKRFNMKIVQNISIGKQYIAIVGHFNQSITIIIIDSSNFGKIPGNSLRIS